MLRGASRITLRCERRMLRKILQIITRYRQDQHLPDHESCSLVVEDASTGDQVELRDDELQSRLLAVDVRLAHLGHTGKPPPA